MKASLIGRLKLVKEDQLNIRSLWQTGKPPQQSVLIDRHVATRTLVGGGTAEEIAYVHKRRSLIKKKEEDPLSPTRKHLLTGSYGPCIFRPIVQWYSLIVIDTKMYLTASRSAEVCVDAVIYANLGV